MSFTGKFSISAKWYIFPFLLFLLACPAEDEPPEPPDPEEYLELGWALLDSRFYEDAFDNFHTADSLLDYQNVEANMGKAWCLFFTDSGTTLNLMEDLFETGISDSTWSADAFCGLSIVSFAQENFIYAIAYVDSLLSLDEDYEFNRVSDIGLDHRDIRLVKAQAQFLTQDYDGANETLSEIPSDDSLDRDQEESWEVNGISYFSFESALAALIALITLVEDSGGFISSP